MATHTYYVYDEGQIVLQFDGNEAADLSHRYLWGVAVDQLLAAEQVSDLEAAGEVVWPLGDHLGTIRDLAVRDEISGERSIASHRVYDSFGNLISGSAVDLIFGFTGRMFDAATGLQNNLHRWYDPRTAKWTSEDPIGFAAGDENLQRYVGNSPTMYTDPSGLELYGPNYNVTGNVVKPSGPRQGPSGLEIFFMDYMSMFNSSAMSEKKDAFDHVMVVGKKTGWTMFYVCGGMAVGLQVAGGLGVIHGAGTIFIGSSVPAAGSGMLIGGTATGLTTAELIAAGGPGSATAGKVAVDIFAGAGNNPGFGRLIGWGVGAQDAIARTGSITLCEVQRAGITREIAQHWLQFYLQRAAQGRGGETAIERARLMQRILDLLDQGGG